MAAIVYLYDKWEERVEREKRELAEKQEQRLRREEQETAKKLVSLAEVEIVERRLLSRRGQAPESDLGAERIFTGRVRNKSTRYELSAIQVELTVKDCVEDDCEIIGQDTSAITLDIPPGQSRDFRETFSFKPTLGKPRGRFVWSHRVVQACSNSGLRTLPCSFGARLLFLASACREYLPIHVLV
jgi:hypothetical protein